MNKEHTIQSFRLLCHLASESTNDHRTLAKHIQIVEKALPKVNVLILDDSAERMKRFNSFDVYGGPGYNLIMATKYQDALKALFTTDWDVISLDHDLGNEDDGADSYIDNAGKKQFYTGMHLVREIIYGNIKPGRVIVHSTNTVEGPHMRDDLIRVGIKTIWFPFSL